MAVKSLAIMNAQSPIGSLTFAIPVGRVVVSVMSVTSLEADCRAELKSGGQKLPEKAHQSCLRFRISQAT